MKIGLVTIAHGQNYGNRLQNCAIQQIFEDMGHQVETIRHPYFGFSKKVLAGIFVKKMLNYRYTKEARRIWKFTRFNNKNIRFSKLYIKSGNVDVKLSESYDLFLCGSDQVWNPNYFVEKDSYFLSFVEGKKKIALSASFGIEEIESEEEKERISKRLNELTAISVREKSGQDLVKSLSGRDSELVIDPTMYLTPERWRIIEKKPKNVESNAYVLIYLLGKYPKERIEKIKQYFIEQGKKVVLLENEYSNLGMCSDEEFAIDPSEFIWLIRNSHMVVTDSFHAIAFSLQFQKKFTIVKRDTMEEDISSRIKNLIDIFDIKNPYYEDSKDVQAAIVDNSYVNYILTVERAKFMNFIESNVYPGRDRSEDRTN